MGWCWAISKGRKSLRPLPTSCPTRATTATTTRRASANTCQSVLFDNWSIINNFNRIIVAWGDGIFPAAPGNPAAPSIKLFKALKSVSRMLGRFPRGHRLAGQQRLLVLKVNENFSSQMPSCWTGGDDGHPALPNALPPTDQRLHQVEDIWAVKQCPHCLKIWQRDVNACRYVIIYSKLL